MMRYTKMDNQPLTDVPPLPALTAKAPFLYSGAHGRDPFVPMTQKITQADLSGTDNVLAKLPLAALRMVGTIRFRNVLWALIAADNGNAYHVTVGDSIGKHEGIIQAITTEHVYVKERVYTKAGEWIYKNTIMDVSGLRNQKKAKTQ